MNPMCYGTPCMHVCDEQKHFSLGRAIRTNIKDINLLNHTLLCIPGYRSSDCFTAIIVVTYCTYYYGLINDFTRLGFL
jgi:hypothetical protein